MAETITMPKLGFDMAEGILVRWLKKEGESINKGEVLAEIETDKATVEVESSAVGTVRRLLIDEGAVVPVGQAIAIVGSPDERIEEPASATGAKSPESAVPRAAQVEISPAVPPSPLPVTTTPVMPSADQPALQLKASPLARRIAEENRIDIARLQGSGPGGRIVKRDIEMAMSARGSAVSSQLPTAAALAAPASSRKPLVNLPLPTVTPLAHADETVSLSRLRQAIGRRMLDAKTNAPHFYVSHEYKLDALMGLREQVNSYLPDEEKLTINDFIVKAAALTLRQFPNLNATFQGDKLLQHGSIHIGVAVTVEGGLLTIVCRDADQKPLRLISAELKAKANRVREGKVHPDDIEGSTFSTSNLGMFEVENFIAILNPPEAAILAIGSVRQIPVVESGQVVVGWRMKATISVDHRVSDGAEAARFMQALAAFLEEPLKLLV